MNPEQKELQSPSDYETKSEIARRLHVSQRTIDNMMKQRRLPFIKLTSKIVRFGRAEVDAFLARNLQIQATVKNKANKTKV